MLAIRARLQGMALGFLFVLTKTRGLRRGRREKPLNSSAKNLCALCGSIQPSETTIANRLISRCVYSKSSRDDKQLFKTFQADKSPVGRSQRQNRARCHRKKPVRPFLWYQSRIVHRRSRPSFCATGKSFLAGAAQIRIPRSVAVAI